MHGTLKLMRKLRYSIYIHLLFGSLCLGGWIVTKKWGFRSGTIYWMPAPADNRVLEANAQRLRLSQSLETLGDIRIDEYEHHTRFHSYWNRETELRDLTSCGWRTNHRRFNCLSTGVCIIELWSQNQILLESWNIRNSSIFFVDDCITFGTTAKLCYEALVAFGNHVDGLIWVSAGG